MLRVPTDEEKKELALYIAERDYIKHTSEELKYLEESIDNQSIAVFNDYITDGPGYAGKLMVVVWGGAPEFTETFVWTKNKIDQVTIGDA